MTTSPLAGQVAVVTGGTRGIGRAIALALAGAGADVVVGYSTRAEPAAQTVAAIQHLGRRATSLAGDVSLRTDVQTLMTSTLEEFGRIDVLVNNAGLLQQKPFPEITDEDWDRVLDVNLKGTFLCSQEVLPVMLRQESGRIINIASSGGQLGGTLAPHYAASKAGVISLTKSLARLGAPHVGVNCISPGLIETEMTAGEIASEEGRAKIQSLPLGRAGTAAEVADAAMFLASSATYVTGQTINVNGGLYLG